MPVLGACTSVCVLVTREHARVYVRACVHVYMCVPALVTSCLYQPKSRRWKAAGRACVWCESYPQRRFVWLLVSMSLGGVCVCPCQCACLWVMYSNLLLVETAKGKVAATSPSLGRDPGLQQQGRRGPGLLEKDMWLQNTSSEEHEPCCSIT